MLRGIALAQHLIPCDLLETLQFRCATRGGEPEVQFLWWHKPRVLPVWDEGHLRLIPWGCKRTESRNLPVARSTWSATFEAGGWAQWSPRRVEVPSSLILEGSVWALVQEGIQAILVTDEYQQDRVFTLCEPASYYYRVMTRGEWMPLLINERF
jgi:hypothetical protein